MPETNEIEFYMWLGKKYQELREKKGIKQKEAAAKAGLSQSELSKFEIKGKKLSAYRIVKLLDVLEIKFKDLLDEEGKKNSRSLSMATC